MATMARSADTDNRPDRRELLQCAVTLLAATLGTWSDLSAAQRRGVAHAAAGFLSDLRSLGVLP